MHCTPEQLALAALREPLPADDAVHLDRCERCRDQVAALQRGVDALAVPELATAGPGVPPPPAVWEAIAAATGVQVSPRPEWTVTEDSGGMGRLGTAPMQPDYRARPRRPHRLFQRRLPLAAVGAVAAAGLGAGITLGAVTLADRPASSQVAATRLQALEGNGAAGTAVVVEHHDHTLALEVTLRGSRPASGYYEAWLADAGLHRMVAVGALHDGTTTLPLPTGLSLTSYPVVDVSVQQLDGNPAHSDHSVARGLFR